MKKFEMLKIIYKNCNLTSKEILVAQYFVYKSNKKGSCYPSVNTIAKECGVSERTVQRATGKLREKGFISIEKRTINGRQTSNEYKITVYEPENVTGTGNTPGQAKDTVAEEPCPMKIIPLEGILYGADPEPGLDSIFMDSISIDNTGEGNIESLLPMETGEDSCADAQSRGCQSTIEGVPETVVLSYVQEIMSADPDQYDKTDAYILLFILKWVLLRFCLASGEAGLQAVRTLDPEAAGIILPYYVYCYMVYRRLGASAPFLGVSP